MSLEDLPVIVKKPKRFTTPKSELNRHLYKITEKNIKKADIKNRVKITTEQRRLTREIRSACWRAANDYANTQGALARATDRAHDWQKLVEDTYHELLEQHDVETEAERLRFQALTMSDDKLVTTIEADAQKQENVVIVTTRYARPHPARKLEVNQKYFVPCSAFRARSLSGIIYKIAKETGRLFTTRVCTEDGTPGMWVWRIK